MAEFRTEKVEARSRTAPPPDATFLDDRTAPPEDRRQKTADQTRQMEKDGHLPKVELGEVQNAPLAKVSADTLKDRYGIETVKNGDRAQYKMPNVSNETIAESGANNDGMRRVERLLQQRRDEKVNELETKFNVSIAKDGELVTTMGRTFAARSPRLDELVAVEAGLVKSQPAIYGEQVRLVFAKDNVWGSAGVYALDKLPMVVIEPNESTKRHGMLESDAKVNNPGMIGHTLESVMLHELGHHSQWKAKWDDKPTRDAMARKMGWEPFELPDGSESFMLRTKDGRHLRCDDGASEEKKWLFCSSNGVPLNAEGKPTTEKGAARMSNASMLQVAEIKPVAPYPNPCEMQADGLKYFRIDAEHRAKLLKTDSDFYTQIEEMDQAETNKVWGAGKYMRNPNGALVPISDAAKREVFLFEVQAQNKKR